MAESPPDLSPAAAAGLELFRGRAGCAACHTMRNDAWTFSDDGFHPTPFKRDDAAALPDTALNLMRAKPDASRLGPDVLADKALAELGRFVVTRDPADIGLFRTPSLWNVGLTAPYMHDGRIATLDEAVDEEIYYRTRPEYAGLITADERKLIADFLRELKR